MPKKPREPKPLRPEEEHVRATLQQDLKVEVKQHDDGMAESVYDLRIMYPGRPHGPVEVKSHVNGKMLGTLNNLGSRANGGIWVSRELSRVWVLTADTTVTVATFWPAAEEHLAALEAAQTYQFRVSAARSAYVGAHMGGMPVPVEVQCQLELAGLGRVS